MKACWDRGFLLQLYDRDTAEKVLFFSFTSFVMRMLQETVCLILFNPEVFLLDL